MTTKTGIARAFADLDRPARYKAYFGGRGSGKSHAFAAALIRRAYRAPVRILCAREVQRSIKDSVRQLLVDKIRALGVSERFSCLDAEIRGSNGSKFIFCGLQDKSADQIKSYEGIDIVWVEEAQTISARSLEVLVPTIRRPGSELWFSWNPRHRTDPVDLLFRGAEVPDDAIIRKVTYDDNPFFPSELEAERLFDRRAKPDRYAHIWIGDYEPAAIGAIWDRATLHENRRKEPAELGRVLVAVDPAVSAETGSNEHGILVGGLGDDRRGYVLDDLTTTGPPKKWAERAIAAFDRYEADAIVIETNQGGDMVRHTLQSVRAEIPVIEVRATRGKHVRAEPIAALYALGRISHVGTFPELENQMCQMTAGGYEGAGSPDRCDALVWLLTELFPDLARRDTKPIRRGVPPGRGDQVSWMAS